MTDKKKASKVVASRRLVTFVTRQLMDGNYFVSTLYDRVWVRSNWPYMAQPGYPHFHVCMSSHMYINRLDKSWTITELPNKVKEWFETSNRKQLGAHIFSTNHGKVLMLYNHVIPNTTTIAVTEGHEIHSIYPVVSNNEKKGSQSLLLGLFFGYCGQTRLRKLGHRLYHKFGKQLIEYNNCWEINETMLEQNFFLQWQTWESHHRFAIFVCPSAKLVVTDDCTPNGKTRSLIQQGGLIVVEGTLLFRIKELEYSYALEDLVDQHILVVGKDGYIAKNYQNPVFFLGPTDSNCGSSCWDLTISQNIKGRFNLMIPQEGFFHSIENWKDGMDEIWARHQYQRLHESNVMPAEGQPPFSKVEYAIPEKVIMAKLLGPADPFRRVDFNYKVKLPKEVNDILSAQPSLPNELNFRKLSQLENDLIVNIKGNRNLMIPPAYPPIECKSQNSLHYLYLPNNKEPMFEDNPQKHYVYELIDGQQECCLQYGDRIYRLSKDKTITMEEYEAFKNEHQFADSLDRKRSTLCDGQTTRLGADGWIYRSDEKVIANYETYYYYRYK